jgi:plasmid stabilization system protein ParE
VSYSLEIRPEALADIEQAAEWYEKQEPSLGIDFARIVLDSIENLRRNPLIYRLRDRRRNVRWFRAHRFPYRVVYQVRDEVITVVAILHIARLDRHWKRRL